MTPQMLTLMLLWPMVTLLKGDCTLRAAAMTSTGSITWCRGNELWGDTTLQLVKPLNKGHILALVQWTLTNPNGLEPEPVWISKMFGLGK